MDVYEPSARRIAARSCGARAWRVSNFFVLRYGRYVLRSYSSHREADHRLRLSTGERCMRSVRGWSAFTGQGAPVLSRVGQRRVLIRSESCRSSRPVKSSVPYHTGRVPGQN